MLTTDNNFSRLRANLCFVDYGKEPSDNVSPTTEISVPTAELICNKELSMSAAEHLVTSFLRQKSRARNLPETGMNRTCSIPGKFLS